MSKIQGKMYYIIVILSVLSAACAQMLLKKGAMLPLSPEEGLWLRFLHQYLNPWVLGGCCILFASMAVNIYAMNKGVQVKEVSSIEALSYLFVPCLSWFFFGESITWRKAGAIAIIITGIIIFLN